MKKCEKAVTSRDLIEAVTENSDDVEATLECKIGVTAQMLMQFQ